MDNLTHGLLGLAIGALRRPDATRPHADLPAEAGTGGLRLSPTDRAVLLASFVAAELPDLDSFWPEPNSVLHALRAHRGISHALVLAPVWAGVATALAWLIFRRRARLAPVYAFSVLSVLVAHLLADLWTGWGTRLFLPFSDQRASLDWAGVIDPLFTLPLLLGAVAALLRRSRWRQALLVGLACSTAYMGVRVGSRAILHQRVAAIYPSAERVEVFPALLSAWSWRYVAVLPEGNAAGLVPLFGAPIEQRLHPFSQPVPEGLRREATVDEALRWARIPVVSWAPIEGGGSEVRVADLRYHIGGDPTLTFVIRLDATGEVVHAELDRGGTARELLERYRQEPH